MRHDMALVAVPSPPLLPVSANPRFCCCHPQVTACRTTCRSCATAPPKCRAPPTRITKNLRWQRGRCPKRVSASTSSDISDTTLALDQTLVTPMPNDDCRAIASSFIQATRLNSVQALEPNVQGQAPAAEAPCPHVCSCVASPPASQPEGRGRDTSVRVSAVNGEREMHWSLSLARFSAPVIPPARSLVPHLLVSSRIESRFFLLLLTCSSHQESRHEFL